jgi:outer membrane lipoprotein carrier protein
MSSLLRLLLAALLLLASIAAHAASPEKTGGDPASIVARLQKKHQQLRSLEFDFAQATQNGGRTKLGNGNAVFYRLAETGAKAGGVMRWNYIEPTVQTIINDGKELSIYTPQDKQLIVSPVQDMESDVTYALFTGTRSLLDEFAVSAADPLFALSDPPKDMDAVLLTPSQPHPQIKRIQLWLDGDHALHRLLMEDHFGALTELTFSRMRFNALRPGDAQKAQSLLHLDLAPGTETIRQ